MRDHLFYFEPSDNESLQTQIRTMMVHAIRDGHIPPGSPIPSCRELARKLSVSRNTVVLTYEKLVDDGFLYSRERSGYFVADSFQPSCIRRNARQCTSRRNQLDWRRRLQVRPDQQRNIVKPRDWRNYPYPFIYGQLDHELFPFNEWRECSREANSKHAIREWFSDSIDGDDPMLLEQLHTKVLPERGVWANPDEILITLGTQHSLYLVSNLLMSENIVVGIEDPGYVDARNIFETSGARVVPIPLDDEGMVVDERMDECDVVYVTPSHQSPTTVTMSLERRRALLAKAQASDVIIIEDDYESETNFLKDPIPALKSLDENSRVIYVSSLSKTLAPGLRMGYMVAPTPFIHEARALRRLMLRHPPSNNQHTVALFLARGYHDTAVHRLTRIYNERWHTMSAALDRYLPDVTRIPTYGGTSFWVRGPRGMDAISLAQRAADKGILVEPGNIHFMADNPPRNYLRLGFAAISEDKIEAGIMQLTSIIDTFRVA
ncbi:MocR-like pyridoxine biosynthesis transcription factor PdxR [Salinisphaera aquimarina]|uniref:PLP-dependent aminotransferase family protein n=1 Tax=Salinisphaera aquimarina TaxID=2094031 RepID=A0ABV7EQE8_9GAMM